MGLGNIIGGALAGVGQGYAQQGMAALEERRQMALEALRQQNNLALEDRRSTNQREEIKVQGSETRRSQVNAGSVEVATTAAKAPIQMKMDANRSALETARQERIARVQSELSRGDAAAAAELAQATATGQVSDTFQDTQGNYYAVMKDGSIKPLGVRGVIKTGGNSVWDDPASPPTAPTVAPNAAVPRSRPPLSQFDN